MRIAVEGCCHGELDKIYDTIKELEKQNDFKVDLLIICGDFQAVRNFDDLQAMAVPRKYQHLNTFYKYYNGDKVAPVLTVFIGGNHEASNYMQELPYGGWAAPNIYYMGYAGIIQIGGLRIGGISGIFKGHDYNRGHFETPPYDDKTKRSVYHVRNLEVFRLKQITHPVNIFFSHDWPRGIYHHGDVASLIKRKHFFQKEIEENKLGSGPLYDLLSHLQPDYWFAAHLHVKFAALVQHKQPVSQDKDSCITKFLALDKCLPQREFLQLLEIPHDEKEGLRIKLDPEWLGVLQNTNHLLNVTPSNVYMPGPGSGMRFDLRVTDQEMKTIVETFGGDMTLPENFVHTSPPLIGMSAAASRQKQLMLQVNPQTTLLCSMLDITDPNAKLLGKTSQELLDECSLNLATQDATENDSGDDVVYDNSDDDEMPSSIDSSIDVSVSLLSTNVSSTWDDYETANESIDISDNGRKRLSLVTSTPAKDGFISSDFSLNHEVDDDEEFLSIMSAQKSVSLCSSSQLESSSLLSDGNVSSSAIPHHENVVDSSSSNSNQLIVGPAIRESQDNSIISSNDNQLASLKSERTSFGMSGLCLNSTDSSDLTSQDNSSPSSGKKRVVSENSVVAPVLESQVMADSSSVKKLKRRNVSFYSDPLE